jgi:hypothetical protein
VAKLRQATDATSHLMAANELPAIAMDSASRAEASWPTPQRYDAGDGDRLMAKGVRFVL